MSNENMAERRRDSWIFEWHWNKINVVFCLKSVVKLVWKPPLWYSRLVKNVWEKTIVNAVWDVKVVSSQGKTKCSKFSMRLRLFLWNSNDVWSSSLFKSASVVINRRTSFRVLLKLSTLDTIKPQLTWTEKKKKKLFQFTETKDAAWWI